MINNESVLRELKDKTVLITGATGLLGKQLIELLCGNEVSEYNINIIAVGRSREKFMQRFSDTRNIDKVQFLQHDVQNPLLYEGEIDYIIHLASNTHPRLYATDPIGTVLTNVIGTNNLLNLAATKKACRFVFASSGDIYGDCKSGNELIKESECGYIDCNTLRAGYIEGKRVSEALCNAYKEASGTDFVIARLCRLYGSQMQIEDSKAISQFIKCAVKGENIVLKSNGLQEFSYLHIYDAAMAILAIMTRGKSGEAYNVADNEQTATLRELAGFCADIAGTQVIGGMQDEQEKKGASKFSNVRLDAGKLYELGWKSSIGLKEGLQETIFELKKR